MTIQTHHLPRLLNALIFYPMSSAQDMLLRYQHCIDTATEPLGLMAGFMTGQDGQPMMFIAMHWSGSETSGELLLEDLLDAPGALALHRGRLPYAESLGIFDPLIVNGRNHHIATRTSSESTTP